MKRLNCLTPFLDSGTRFKLPSGETFDQLRQPQPSSPSLTASTSAVSPTLPEPTAPQMSISSDRPEPEGVGQCRLW